MAGRRATVPQDARTDARAAQDAAMSEKQLQDAVIEAAQRIGWRVAHFRPARTATGWRTPVEADGAGFPDLLMLRDDQLIVAELKSEDGKLSTEQFAWLAAFQRVQDATGFDVITIGIWRPSDWSSGRIERVLRGERE